MTTLTYTRQLDGTFAREGTVNSRYVYVSVLRDGLWSDPLIPIRRTRIVELIEAELSTGAAHLPGEVYRLTEVESTLSQDDRERLAALRLSRRNENEECFSRGDHALDQSQEAN